MEMGLTGHMWLPEELAALNKIAAILFQLGIAYGEAVLQERRFEPACLRGS
jgi:hypothetical protein